MATAVVDFTVPSLEIRAYAADRRRVSLTFKDKVSGNIVTFAGRSLTGTVTVGSTMVPLDVANVAGAVSVAMPTLPIGTYQFRLTSSTGVDDVVTELVGQLVLAGP